MKYLIGFLKLLFPQLDEKNKREIIAISVLFIIVFFIMGYMMWNGYL